MLLQMFCLMRIDCGIRTMVGAKNKRVQRHTLGSYSCANCTIQHAATTIHSVTIDMLHLVCAEIVVVKFACICMCMCSACIFFKILFTLLSMPCIFDQKLAASTDHFSDTVASVRLETLSLQAFFLQKGKLDNLQKVIATCADD